MSFPGATAYFIESQGVSLEAVEDDHTEEIESLEASFQVDDQQLSGQLRMVAHESESTSNKGQSGILGPSDMAEQATSHDMVLDHNLKKASEHVIVSSTLSNYERWATFDLQDCAALSRLTVLDMFIGFGSSSSSSVWISARPKLWMRQSISHRASPL